MVDCFFFHCMEEGLTYGIVIGCSSVRKGLFYTKIMKMLPVGIRSILYALIGMQHESFGPVARYKSNVKGLCDQWGIAVIRDGVSKNRA